MNSSSKKHIVWIVVFLVMFLSCDSSVQNVPSTKEARRSVDEAKANNKRLIDDAIKSGNKKLIEDAKIDATKRLAEAEKLLDAALVEETNRRVNQ